MTYALQRVSVLIIEDNQPMLDITRSLLEVFGVGHILSAQNGEVGFQIYNRHQPDLIIADWMMEPVDGISFTRMVRNSPKSTNPFVPIILMTGFSEKRRVFQARDAGVTEFLVKPFNAEDLYKRMLQVIERPRQYVRAPDFFGPDRRRRVIKDYHGPMRRQTDSPKNLSQREILARQKRAHETLRNIRQTEDMAKGEGFKASKDSDQ